MKTSFKLKNGEEWFLKYICRREEIEVIPFLSEVYDKSIYMDDGIYLLDDDKLIEIKDKKIIKIS